ncbi:MAG: glycosyltransferase [Lysobacteraceae bacterium]
MDILMLSDVYFPRVNGVSTSIRTFVRWLDARGHRVTLVAPDYGDDGAHDPPGQVQTRRLPARTIFFDPEDRLVRGDAVAAAAERLAGEGAWDLIHVHTPFRAHQLGVRLSRRTRTPVVETYHTFFEEYVGHYLPWLPEPPLRWGARWASRRMCHEVDHLIVPTGEMAGVLEGYGVRTPSTVLPTGVDLSEFGRGDGAAFRARNGIHPGRRVIVTVSRLAVEKNIAFLLRMLVRLREQVPDILLLIAGEGPDGPRLRRLVRELGLDEHVRFFGNLDRRTSLLDCYRAGDAFVFASPTETQGLVLIEAMAQGVPIVSTAVMGTATVLRGARSARVAPEDEAGFAAEVAALLADPAALGALAEAGPADARRWDVEPLMSRAEDLYRRLAGARVASGRRLRAGSQAR